MDERGIVDIPVPITNELERRIAEAFEIFDHGGNKTIDIREVGTVVRSLGCCPSEAEIQEILIACEDLNMPGSIHLSKFLPHVSQMLTEHKHEPASPEKLLEAFHVLDPEGKGFITKEQITMLMTQDGEPFSQEELDEMLEIAIDPLTQTVPYEYYLNKLMVSWSLELEQLFSATVYCKPTSTSVICIWRPSSILGSLLYLLVLY